jgi:hypothetical protein
MAAFEGRALWVSLLVVPWIAATGVATASPHPSGRAWLDRGSAQFHGRSDLSCEDCHDQENMCSRCHFGPDGSRVPERSGWRHGAKNHSAQAGSGGACVACHRINRAFGRGPRPCHDCHGDDEWERNHRGEDGEEDEYGSRHERENHWRRRGRRHHDDDD